MPKESNAWILTRRSALTLAGACLVPYKGLYASEFWDKKDPSQWTGEEIDRLTTKSPWAKSVTAQYAPGSNQGGYGQGQGGGYPRNGGGMGGGGIGMGIPGMGRRGGGMGRPGGGYPQNSQYKGTVRWESAQPVLDALKTPLPDAFAKHYVIGVRDIPLIANNSRNNQNSQYPDDTNQDSRPTLNTQGSSSSGSDSNSNKRALDDLKTFTTLTPKGRDSAEPEIVQQMTPGGTYFLFGFSKIFLDFDKKVHEVEFTTTLGRLMVKCKFDPSEMLYHGNLAV
jgi:hypothetical protein